MSHEEYTRATMAHRLRQEALHTRRAVRSAVAAIRRQEAAETPWGRGNPRLRTQEEAR